MRRPALALLTALLPALAGLGLLQGWWRPNHPDPRRFSVWGVDVSHHQGAIDWGAVATTPQLSFAWVKATEGGDFDDPRFLENWRGARDAGLRVGAYHYFTFCRSGLEQAAHFLRTLPDDPDTLPPAVDVEFGGNCRAPDVGHVTQELTAFLHSVEEATGRAPIVYATWDAWREFVLPAGLSNAVWLRDVWTEPTLPDGRRWAVWQFASRARVAGIDGFVDLNVVDPSITSLARVGDALGDASEERSRPREGTCGRKSVIYFRLNDAHRPPERLTTASKIFSRRRASRTETTRKHENSLLHLHFAPVKAVFGALQGRPIARTLREIT